MVACSVGNTDIVEILLNTTVDINHKEKVHVINKLRVSSGILMIDVTSRLGSLVARR